MIELERVSKRYGEAVVVDDVSLVIRTGEFCVLVGSSGAGKSTLLRMINRLVVQTEGRIRIGGADIAGLDLETLRRRMGYVIQSIGLFPHWTVARNIAAVPDLLGWPADKSRARAAELLTRLQLDPVQHLDRYPHQLSIGQQQRVGIARALAADPEVLLMDEPFGALDPVTRAALQAAIAEIQRDSGKTVVFVTHDMDEALMLASRIAVMDHGRIVQLGTPLELLTAPADDFVRALVGQDDLGLKLLGLVSVGERVQSGESAEGAPISASASLRQALSRMIAERRDRLAVIASDGRSLGAIRLPDLLRR